MQQIILKIIIFSLILTGCNEKKPPVDMLTIKSILMDIYVAEAYSAFNDSTKNLEKNKDYEKLAVSYASILKHHGMSQESFLNAMDWYFDHPKYYDSVYRLMILEMDSLQIVFGSDNSKKEEGNSRVEESKRTSANDHVIEKEIESMKSNPRKNMNSVVNKEDTSTKVNKNKPSSEFKTLSEVNNE